MTTISNAENLRQSTFSIFSSIVEHILGLVSSINWVREVKNVSSTFKRTTCMFLKIPIWIDRFYGQKLKSVIPKIMLL